MEQEKATCVSKLDLKAIYDSVRGNESGNTGRLTSLVLLKATSLDFLNSSTGNLKKEYKMMNKISWKKLFKMEKEGPPLHTRRKSQVSNAILNNKY